MLFAIVDLFKSIVTLLFIDAQKKEMSLSNYFIVLSYPLN